MGILDAPGLTTAGLRRRAGGGAAGIFRTIDNTLDNGYCASIQVQGDSTGDETTEWVYGLTTWLAARHPNAAVQYRLWDTANGRYAAFQSIQNGALGRRYADFPTNSQTFSTASADLGTVASDIDVRIELSLSNWTSNTSRVLVQRWPAAPNRMWQFTLNSANKLGVSLSADGTNSTVVQQASTALSFAADTTNWVRFTLSGTTLVFYTSSDGITWTTVSTHTIAAVTFVTGTANLEIGGYPAALNATGKFYTVEVRDGINGKIVNPQPIEAFVPRIASGSLVAGLFGGSPTLYVLNGSAPGSASAYHYDTTRHPMMVQPYNAGPNLNIWSTSHNDSGMPGPTYLAARDAWLALTDARTPGSPVLVLQQNPRISPVDPYSIYCHAKRVQALASWAVRRSLLTVDTYTPFVGHEVAYINADGIHPNATGTAAWLQAITDAWKLG